MASGKVYIVGAGPGHPDLLTVKAAKLLETADVVVYDRLIQEEVLALAKPSAERIYMGKPVGMHDSRQDEIHELLVRKACEGNIVVRLKGGDPFLFGRGGEEAEYLSDHGVAFEVIPGISSALAAPLSAGIAVTHRDVASAVAIVTGHEASRDSSRLNWDALAAMDSLVFLMAVHSVERIARELVAHGRAPDTPAAMIQMAFWHGEKVVTGTLDTIASEVERAGISPPATLVVGEAVRLREKLKQSERDLARRPDHSPCFAPAPSPDQLLRMATAGMGSQVLRFGMAVSLFDQLDQWRTTRELAHRLGLNAHGLAEVLECLVSMGLLESGPQGYRNLELASRYLVEESPQSLRSAMLYHAAHLASLTEVGRYVLNGRDNGGAPDIGNLHESSCECLARYSAPLVLDRVDLAAHSPVLVVGWGGETYRETALARWPRLVFETRNPFAGGRNGGPAAAIPAGDGPYGAVMFSGMLSCCERDQYQPALAHAAGVLRPGGLLVLHDSFLGSETSPSPEVLLSALGRHVIQGGCRNWSVGRLTNTLDVLGLRVLETHPIPSGTQLVTASKL